MKDSSGSCHQRSPKGNAVGSLAVARMKISSSEISWIQRVLVLSVIKENSERKSGAISGNCHDKRPVHCFANGYGTVPGNFSNSNLRSTPRGPFRRRFSICRPVILITEKAGLFKGSQVPTFFSLENIMQIIPLSYVYKIFNHLRLVLELCRRDVFDHVNFINSL